MSRAHILPETASFVLNVNNNHHHFQHTVAYPRSYSHPHRTSYVATSHVAPVPQSVTTTTDDEQPANAQITPSPPEQGAGPLVGASTMNPLTFTNSYSESRSHRSQTTSPKQSPLRHKSNRSNTTLDVPDLSRRSPSHQHIDPEEEDMDEEAFDRILLSCLLSVHSIHTN